MRKVLCAVLAALAATALAASCSRTFVWNNPVDPDIVPPTPTLAMPGNGAVGVSTSPKFSWNASPGAVSYTIQVAGDASFSLLVHGRSGIASTRDSIAGLSPGQSYFWKVRADKERVSSPWSGTWSFATSPVQAP